MMFLATQKETQKTSFWQANLRLKKIMATYVGVPK